MGQIAVAYGNTAISRGIKAGPPEFQYEIPNGMESLKLWILWRINPDDKAAGIATLLFGLWRTTCETDHLPTGQVHLRPLVSVVIESR